MSPSIQALRSLQPRAASKSSAAGAIAWGISRQARVGCEWRAPRFRVGSARVWLGRPKRGTHATGHLSFGCWEIQKGEPTIWGGVPYKHLGIPDSALVLSLFLGKGSGSFKLFQCPWPLGRVVVRESRKGEHTISWWFLGNVLHFASCGLVVEIQPLNCLRFNLLLPFQRQPRFGGGPGDKHLGGPGGIGVVDSPSS